jgi:hypothetical protein
MSTAPYASGSTTYQPRKEPPSPVAAIVAIFLGLAVAALIFFGLLMWVDVHKARDDANHAAAQAKSAASMPGMAMSSSAGASAGTLTSDAGAARPRTPTRSPPHTGRTPPRSPPHLRVRSRTSTSCCRT